MAGCTLFGAASSRGCAGPPRRGFGSEWPSSGGPLRDANRQSWRSAHSARIVRGGGHVWDVAEMEQQLRARGFVEVETCSILPTCLGDRPPTLAGTPRTGGLMAGNPLITVCEATAPPAQQTLEWVTDPKNDTRVAPLIFDKHSLLP